MWLPIRNGGHNFGSAGHAAGLGQRGSPLPCPTRVRIRPAGPYDCSDGTNSSQHQLPSAPRGEPARHRAELCLHIAAPWATPGTLQHLMNTAHHVLHVTDWALPCHGSSPTVLTLLPLGVRECGGRQRSSSQGAHAQWSSGLSLSSLVAMGPCPLCRMVILEPPSSGPRSVSLWRSALGTRGP